MLADSAASAMAAVVSEAAALLWRPAQHSSNQTHSGGTLKHCAAGASGDAGTATRRPPPRPLPEQLAAAGYLADLTWVLEGACGGPVASGSSAASGPVAAAPFAGLWAAHNALAAVAGWLEGSLQYTAGRPDAAAAPPSATLQAAVARAAVAMVGRAQRLLASGAGAGASGSSGGSGSGYSGPVRGSRQPWRADSAPCRMACTGVHMVLCFSPICFGCAFIELGLWCTALVRHSCRNGRKLWR